MLEKAVLVGSRVVCNVWASCQRRPCDQPKFLHVFLMSSLNRRDVIIPFLMRKYLLPSIDRVRSYDQLGVLMSIDPSKVTGCPIFIPAGVIGMDSSEVPITQTGPVFLVVPRWQTYVDVGDLSSCGEPFRLDYMVRHTVRQFSLGNCLHDMILTLLISLVKCPWYTNRSVYDRSVWVAMKFEPSAKVALRHLKHHANGRESEEEQSSLH